MNTSERLLDIASRLDHIQCSAEWVARETVHSDCGISQTGTLINVLAEQVKDQLISLVEELEKMAGETGGERLH